MMLQSHCKVAFRNLWKNRGFSAINIAGLALGMACSLLIFLWIQDEKGINGFHKNIKQIYQVYEAQHYDGKIEGQYATPGLLAQELEKQVPAVEMAVSMAEIYGNTFSVGTKALKQKGTAAGKHFFQIFSYPLLQGNAADALATPESIAISRSMAVNFFGSPEKAMLQTIRYENERDYTVKAVFEDITPQSSMVFDFLLNWDGYVEHQDWLKDWGNHMPATYVLFRPGTNVAAVGAKVKNFIERFEDDSKYGFHVEIGFQPYKEVYLKSQFENGKPAWGRFEYVNLFTLVAIFILVIACINFMNLTTARSVKRAREIGVRKVIGANRMSLVWQFMGEAVLIALIAALLALLLIILSLPFFNQVTGKQIAIPIFSGQFLGVMLALILITGFLSGSYPALFLAGFNPVRVLKGGSLQAGPAALWFRKSLVVFQFTLSIILIIATILISQQVDYVQQSNLGYNRENLVAIDIDNEMSKHLSSFTTEAARISGINSMSEVSQVPVNAENSTLGVRWPGKDPKNKVAFTQLGVGYDFIKTMKLTVVEGRDFSKSFLSDSVAYIINEAAAKKINNKNILGMPFTFWGKEGKVIGVVKDFHFQSLHHKINPLVLRITTPTYINSLLVRLEPGHTEATLGSLEKLWKQVNPKFPFSYQFSSEEYAKLYKSEQVIKSLSNVFAFLAIVISCLGLLGLSIFTAEQRTKEFGVRKVLGANFITLCRLLTTNFVLLVGLAFIIAAPIAWWAMYKWLQHYAYHTAISWWIFVTAGLLAMLIALLTVCFQAIKVARTNPLKSLKTE
ncbi:duplicated orphan permease [Filimonas lacunae]|uniref:Duplicated orphan permease n=1 Tax=Filimonas lacunae TaxID=477680 RepID=A0A173MAV3_9BACT|nr:FtsX-like permease family protein [Filimonas lacunae]BAV04657.1 ABC transporter, permease protein [Filimonas lacunae]SIT32470.1 duplicated orphan permease [Filimonas lacunae]